MTEAKILNIINDQLTYIGQDADPNYRSGYNTALKDLLRRINDEKRRELAGNMTEIGDRNYTLISSAVKTTGSYDPKDIFFMFEEELYTHESDAIYKFLEWVSKDVKYRSFGSGNYEQRFQEYRKFNHDD